MPRRREAAKRRWPNESPELDTCLARLGFNRGQRRYGASEDCAQAECASLTSRIPSR